MTLLPELRRSFRELASLLTGAARRSVQAHVAIQYCDSSPRKAESLLGWNRKAVARGIKELRSGTIQVLDSEKRGRPRIESPTLDLTGPELVQCAEQILDQNSQADPKFQTQTSFTRMTGESLRAALADQLRIPISRLPASRSLRRLMNRRNFSLKKVRKTIPQKKIPQTDAIFENVKSAHQRADKETSIVRVSIDCKARVKVGPFSRGGMTRDPKSRYANDHDMADGPLVTPFGILEVASGFVSIGMIEGTVTSDAIVDNLEHWREQRKENYPDVRTIMIDLDNGPDIQSYRTQFVKRIAQLADKSGLTIELVYYPPYHSKYNPIERVWSALERHWNGSLLTTIQSVSQWASTMTWKKLRPMVWMLNRHYEKGS